MFRRLWTVLLGILFTLIAICFWNVPMAAQEIINANQLQNDTPDLQWLSFADLSPTLESGTITSEFDKAAGYQVGRTWASGTSLTDLLKLGDIAEDLGVGRLSLWQIGDVIGEDLTQRSLTSFTLLAQQTLGDLMEAVPNLGTFAIEDMPPIKKLLVSYASGIPVSPDGFELDATDTLKEVLDANPELLELQLGQIGESLSEFTIGQIPNMDLVPLSELKGWKDAQISDIPGLPNLPFGSFPNPVGRLGGAVARIDFIWSPAETDRTNTISGSQQAGFSVPCPDGGRLTKFNTPYEAPEANDLPKCSYLELDDLENEGRKLQGSLEGKQWISGKYHEVEGGFGFLKYVPSPFGYSPGYEPTGRHPFGDAFKVVVWEPDERNDTVSLRLFFRWCVNLPLGGRSCTPYNQFAVPFTTHRINETIFIGPIDGAGGRTGASAAAYAMPGTYLPGVVPSTLPCTGEVIAGVSVDALATSIAVIESLGSGGYEAVGSFICDQEGNCGRGLGRYQMMSYLPEVQAQIKQRGGTEWLAKIEQGHRPTSDEMMQYLPPEAQEAAYREEITQLIDQAQSEIDPRTGQPFEGDRLVERVAQMWFGGPGAPIDGGGSDKFGKLTIYEYGVEAQKNYKAQGKVSDACAALGKSTGIFSNPLPDYPVTSEFGRRIHPVYRTERFHAGIDIGAPAGTPVAAADGGVIIYAGTKGGYGLTVDIDHGNGFVTRYAHLSRIDAQVGQQVVQGQTIGAVGSTGISTGPHLHFEVRENNNPVNPRNYVEF